VRSDQAVVLVHETLVGGMAGVSIFGGMRLLFGH